MALWSEIPFYYLIKLSPFKCTFSVSPCKVYYSAPTENAPPPSNVKPGVSQSEATFHNVFGYVTVYRSMYCRNFLTSPARRRFIFVSALESETHFCVFDVRNRVLLTVICHPMFHWLEVSREVDTSRAPIASDIFTGDLPTANDISGNKSLVSKL